jgi:hypothetical protein
MLVRQRRYDARDSLPHSAMEQALYKQLPSPVVLNMGNTENYVPWEIQKTTVCTVTVFVIQ